VTVEELTAGDMATGAATTDTGSVGFAAVGLEAEEFARERKLPELVGSTPPDVGRSLGETLLDEALDVAGKVVGLITGASASRLIGRGSGIGEVGPDTEERRVGGCCGARQAAIREWVVAARVAGHDRHRIVR